MTHCEYSQRYLWSLNVEKLTEIRGRLVKYSSFELKGQLHLPFFLIFPYVSPLFLYLFHSPNGFFKWRKLRWRKIHGGICVNLCRTSVKEKDHLSDDGSSKLCLWSILIVAILKTATNILLILSMITWNSL